MVVSAAMKAFPLPHPKAVLIAGPTASGKSALALQLAASHRGTIINADSMQVYRDLRVVTARPSLEDERTQPHLLYGHVDGADGYSVARWTADVERAIAEIRAAVRMPVIVGGTGLYFKALLEGLSPLPLIPDAVRALWRAEGPRLPVDELHRILAARDPVSAATLDPSDRQRITRALEVFDATGRSLRDWQATPGQPLLRPDDCLRILLMPPRDVVHKSINSRFDQMMTDGALEEVTALCRRNLDPGLPILKATGVPELGGYLRGELCRDDAVERAKAVTRQYVKRQTTWSRRLMADWSRFETAAAADAFVARMLRPITKA